MKKKYLLFILLASISSLAFAQPGNIDRQDSAEAKQTKIVIPDESSWTERYILSELKEIRQDHEKLKREMLTEIHERELQSVDRALSYSANTVNFFFVFLTITLMGIGVLGWRTIGDVKGAAKNVMEEETKKIIKQFQQKISGLEREQKLNILWRQFWHVETSREKLEILDQIEPLVIETENVMIERSHVYLVMELFDQVVELCNQILESSPDNIAALLDRASAFAQKKEKENALADLQHLLSIAPHYCEMIIENPNFEKLKNDKIFKELIG